MVINMFGMREDVQAYHMGGEQGFDFVTAGLKGFRVLGYRVSVLGAPHPHWPLW
jgi:hypothetical protein